MIVTSNAERQLPDPFLRRCVFHHLEFPQADRLMQIVLEKAFDGPPPTAAERDRRTQLAEKVVAMFGELGPPHRKLIKPPTTSELVQWTQALDRMYAPLVVNTVLGEALRAPKGRVRWGELPALQCLVKLKDDLTALTGAAGA